jgi:hypothetical protein
MGALRRERTVEAEHAQLAQLLPVSGKSDHNPSVH